ncbi:MAG: DUF1549 and DUF1553 domain-containing protein [Planctomycetota bacterium]
MPLQPPRCVFTVFRLPVCLLLAAVVCSADDAVPGPGQTADIPVSFVNDIVPLLTRHGCNAGACHAKAGNGQNGFQLSLLGFEPAEDYEHLVKEARGRRLFAAVPENSLLLLKASGKVPHGGGRRMPEDSPAWLTIRNWISQGAAWDGASAPTLQALEVQPPRGLLPRHARQPLHVFAVYSDGSRQDVTSRALFESNDRAMAEVTEAGVVTASTIPGRASVMVRYQGQVAVFQAVIPLGASVDSLPPSRNFIDDLVFANLRELGIPPSPVCDDATFLRRVSLDIAGRLPTLEETTAFLASTAPDRRDLAIEGLLASPDSADFFAGKWTALLKNRRDDASDITSNFAFHAWVRDSFLANKPYHQFVRELLAATGTVIANPPVAWYKRVREPKLQQEDVAQLFLGVRMQCAQCHHHPFERWSQDDYYGLTAFFSQVGRKPTGTRGEDMIFHKRGAAVAANPRTGISLKPAPLGTEIPGIAPDEDPRLRLADWMSSPGNPFFAKALVNRYWKHFFRRGLIEPEDDIRDSNPPSNPELLAALERHFINSNFDLRDLIRTITRSHTYQLSSQPNEHNQADQQNYSRWQPRRLQAEVLLDSIDDLALSRTDFPNLPPGTRAIALPDNSYNQSAPFLRVFGRPQNESVCECERTQSSSLAQSLHLMNAGDIRGKLAGGGHRADQLSKSQVPVEDRVRELYLRAFSRPPQPGELQTAVEFLTAPQSDATGNPIDPTRAAQEAFQDLIWALINTREFQFNH